VLCGPVPHGAHVGGQQHAAIPQGADERRDVVPRRPNGIDVCAPKCMLMGRRVCSRKSPPIIHRALGLNPQAHSFNRLFRAKLATARDVIGRLREFRILQTRAL
jgi:hypothetical protein